MLLGMSWCAAWHCAVLKNKENDTLTQLKAEEQFSCIS